MPHSADIRIGAGWTDVNINCFYDYLDQLGLELIVSGQNPRAAEEADCLLNTYIEEKVNHYIQWWVFKTHLSLNEGDFNPGAFPDDLWGYVAGKVQDFAKKSPENYYLRKINDE